MSALRLLCVLFALFCSCVAPQHVAPSSPPAPRAALTVALDPTWDSDHRAEIMTALARARDMGAPSRFVRMGTFGAWELLHWDSGAPGQPHHECYHSGETDRDHRVIRIDPVCTPGMPAFRRVVLHEWLHAEGADHVCRVPDELPDANHPDEHCSPVGAGLSVMNPYDSYQRDQAPCNPFAHACGARWYQDEPTDLDRAELARVRGR